MITYSLGISASKGARKMNEITEPIKKWVLIIDIHRGTRASKIHMDPKEMSSLEECKKEIINAERQYASLDYFICSAIAVDPNGNEISLHDGTPYY